MTWVRPALAAGLLLASTAAIAPAQEGAPGMLRDIAQPPQGRINEFWPDSAYFVEYAGALYFGAWEPSEGFELWRSDGTAGGTTLVRDLCPGACSGRDQFEMVVANGILYFTARDGEHGSELWRTDGTTAGTWMVADVAPGPPHSVAQFLTPAPGGLYFVANDRIHGVELWWSDGTAAGTRLVADLFPGDPGGLANAGPSHLIMLGDTLLFSADDGVHGRELWRTDGTPAGTELVRDTLPGPDSGMFAYQAFPRTFYGPALAGGKVFFSAAGSGTPTQTPWASDGTSQGTVQLTVPQPGENGPLSFFGFGDTVLFNGGPDRTLWRSDGTPEGTYPLATVANGMPSGSRFARLGDRAYFVGSESPSTHGLELWATDGTAEGTQLVKDIQMGAEGALHWTITIDALGGRLYFIANDGVHGAELWSSDGTEAGTALAVDLVSGIGDSMPQPLFFTIPAALGQRVLFRAVDGLGTVSYVLDAATHTVDRLRSSADRPSSPWPCIDHLCPMVDATPTGIAFVASDPSETLDAAEPWTSDGRPAGTERAADLRPGPGGSMPAGAFHDAFAMVEGRLLALALDESDAPRVFAIAGGTGSPVTGPLAPESNWRTTLVPWKDAAYFGTADGLFRTDGTHEGTTQLAGGDCVGDLVAAEQNLYFANFGRLWATDGTVQGTRRIAPTVDLQVGFMAPTSAGGSDLVYFYGSEPATGTELWATDGTDAGTRRITDLQPGPASVLPSEPFRFEVFLGDPPPILIATRGLAFFVADDGVAGEELWVSDGIPGNATLLSARPGPESSSPRWLAAVGDRVYFSADDGVHGREPWITRGAPWDTALLEDLRPGPGSSMPRELVAWGDRLALAADDGVHGMELWRTGASDEDHDPPVLHEIRPGPRPASPMGLTVSNGRLFFFADDGVHGLEPWAWPIDPRLFEDGFESGDTSAWESVR